MGKQANMQLSWNEIKDRARDFQSEWKYQMENAQNIKSFEKSNAQTFLIDFFKVFGIDKKRVASFEQSVKKLNVKTGFIDCFWEGKILIEMKSPNENLDAALTQGFDYFHGLKDEQLPAYVMVCDFKRFIIKSLEDGNDYTFELKDFHKNVKLFSFFFNQLITVQAKEEDPVNFTAAAELAKLHEQLESIGYSGHELEVCLVRLIFCLFADDTDIWETNTFENYIVKRTREDGSDLAIQLNQIFEILNTPPDHRLKKIDEDLMQFPYVNGKLFDERLHNAAFDSKMRKILIGCCKLDWSKISPAIFGSIFQNVMEEDRVERRKLGAHYTSERNILKVLQPLFIDDLWSEFEKVKGSQSKLNSFHDKISSLKFLDPACGCGNFLVITYRSLRELELEILKELLFKFGKFRKEVAASAGVNVRALLKCSINQFYGLEIKEFPAQIAQLALWLTDHQMNVIASQEFGQAIPSIPLRVNANIAQGNAIQFDWHSLIKDGGNFNYIVGNPPFSGARKMSLEQKTDMEYCFGKANEGIGSLDYVSAWYKKAANYLKKYQVNQTVRCAFVSTNSIVQGEQVPVFWGELGKSNISVHFAHQTFKWHNEAKGRAAVYCVIIGFSNFEVPKKRLYIYEDIKGNPDLIICNHINGYLIDAPDIFIVKRSTPICSVPNIVFGNMPNDGGALIMSDEEKKEFLRTEPNARKFVKPLISADEFLNGQKRWCLWLVDADIQELRSLPEVIKRVNAVKKHRQKSTRGATLKLAAYPTLFGEIRQPSGNYVLIPRHSSENRKYIPMGFFSKNDIVSDSCLCVPNASLYHFGILMSSMHMAWVNTVCGRLESRYRYSNAVVYNNYPFPQNTKEQDKIRVEQAAQKVLDLRAEFPEDSLADLYGNLMPPKLSKAHQDLDRAVDKCYGSQNFGNQVQRVQYLFSLYMEYTSGLFQPQKKNRKGAIQAPARATSDREVISSIDVKREVGMVRVSALSDGGYAIDVIVFPKEGVYELPKYNYPLNASVNIKLVRKEIQPAIDEVHYGAQCVDAEIISEGSSEGFKGKAARTEYVMTVLNDCYRELPEKERMMIKTAYKLQ